MRPVINGGVIDHVTNIQHILPGDIQMLKPLPQIASEMKTNAAQLIEHGRAGVASVVERTQAKDSAHKAHNFVTDHADLFFLGSAALGGFLAPISFTAGLAAGASMAIARRVGSTDVDTSIVSTTEDKTTFTYLTTIALLLIPSPISGFFSGFTLGDYAGRFGSYERAAGAYNGLRMNLQR